MVAAKKVDSTAGRAIIVLGGFLVGAGATYYINTNWTLFYNMYLTSLCCFWNTI